MQLCRYSLAKEAIRLWLAVCAFAMSLDKTPPALPLCRRYPSAAATPLPQPALGVALNEAIEYARESLRCSLSLNF